VRDFEVGMFLYFIKGWLCSIRFSFWQASQWSVSWQIKQWKRMFSICLLQLLHLNVFIICSNIKTLIYYVFLNHSYKTLAEIVNLFTLLRLWTSATPIALILRLIIGMHNLHNNIVITVFKLQLWKLVENLADYLKINYILSLFLVL